MDHRCEFFVCTPLRLWGAIMQNENTTLYTQTHAMRNGFLWNILFNEKCHSIMRILCGRNERWKCQVITFDRWQINRRLTNNFSTKMWRCQLRVCTKRKFTRWNRLISDGIPQCAVHRRKSVNRKSTVEDGCLEWTQSTNILYTLRKPNHNNNNQMGATARFTQNAIYSVNTITLSYALDK